MNNFYIGREQTLAKHFILRKYLQALTFKLLQGGRRGLTYVDAFSGPWQSKTADFSDTSFMIAINVLKDAHEKYKNKQIRCFFVEENRESYKQLESAVRAYHSPEQGFHVATFNGKFEDAIPQIEAFVGSSFALTFIDPTGWTGYPLPEIAPLLRREGEVLVNFMYDHVNRFAGWDDPANLATFNPILGGPDWKDRLDPSLPRGQAVEKLFRGEIKREGRFKHVLSTHVSKATADRPHFSIVYGTRSSKGLTTFRTVEYNVLRGHEKRLFERRQEIKEAHTGQASLFAASELPDPNSFEAVVTENKENARKWIIRYLQERQRPIEFGKLWELVLERFVLRETNVKDVCVDLAAEGRIKAPWKAERRPKPNDRDLIEMLVER